ncbi:hypothetical protein Fmac_028966 [Flemingia macrophylla]|uniref:Ubiquitin-like protease family profile domain-containing protein n=1 Tax=Flemingia macrophylla TaxID=520843 RepID=A0ABD1L911_9FABA
MTEMLQYDLVFAPVIFNNHWFCYVLETKTMNMHLLDSMLVKHDEERNRLNVVMVEAFEQLLGDYFLSNNTNTLNSS